MSSGDRVDCTFSAVDATVLTLTDRAGKSFTIPTSEVIRIAAPAAKDGLTNGALIGAGTGLGVAVAILSALGSQDGYVLPSAKAGAPILLSAVGALIGILIDRAHHTPERVLYLARRGS